MAGGDFSGRTRSREEAKAENAERPTPNIEPRVAADQLKRNEIDEEDRQVQIAAIRKALPTPGPG
jgi:hypothetical protein